MTRHSRGLLAKLIATVLTVAGVGLVTSTTTSSAQAAAGDVGYADYQYGPGLTGTFIDPDNSPTASKPQSKLWFAQGTWWGVLQVPNTLKTTIHSFNTSTNQWTDTGVLVDERTTPTQADTLWDGTKLYVVSAGRDGSGDGIKVMRYIYSAGQYVPDPGLPAGSLNSGGVEAAVIAKDSVGRLWIAYTASSGTNQRNVRVIVSNETQTSFGAVFSPPVAGTAVNGDDIATVVAHGGSVSVVWSNQTPDATTGETAIYAARHPDTAAPETGWIAAEKVIHGPWVADDHISLSGVEGNAAGSIFIIVKESADDPSHTDSTGLVKLVVLRPSGAWESYVHSTVGDDMTRPIILLEPSKGLLHVFATSPVAGGVVYKKTTSMASPSFAPGKGDPFIKLAAHTFINNATSTKQNITDASGMLVLASDQKTGSYVHSYAPASSTPPATKPTADFTYTPASGPLAVKFTDTSTGTPTSWAWTFGDGGTSTAQHPTYTYTKAGTYTVTLTSSNAAGTSTPKTATVTVVAKPVANFTYTPASGPAPLAVKFIDTSTGAATSWAWTFGDGGTSTAQNPTYTYTKAGTYTATLTASNAAGSSSKTLTVTVAAAQPVPVVVLDAPRTAFTTVPYVDVAWHATNGPATVKSYDVQVSSIGLTRRSKWTTSVVAGQSGTFLRLPGRAGSTYCVQVRGTNVAGAVGAWSEARCTAVPLDDRAMSQKGTWRRASGSGYYMGSALKTRDRGARLTATVTGRQVFLLVTRLKGGGTVKVYDGDRMVKKVSLKASTTRRGQLVPIASYKKDTRAHYKVVVVSRGKKVIIDGLAVTR